MSTPRRVPCQVESICDHGGHVYTVSLAPAGPVPSFRPGHFLHLTVEDYDPGGFWPESRVFSIASSAHDRGRIRICYSVRGRYTKRMEERLTEGSTVWVKLPYGDFMIDATSDVVLLAGGTGISAFAAFLEGLAPDAPNRVTLVYGARTPALFLFKETIQAQLERVPQFKALLFSESATPADVGRRPPCFAGRISLATVWPHMAEPLRAVYYLSGPPEMLTVLTRELRARGLRPDQIRTDAWE